MRRVEDLLALHPLVHGTQGRPRQAVSDLLRGALVLSLAALDAFVVDAVLEAVPHLAKRPGALGPAVAKWVSERPEATLACFSASDPARAIADIGREKLGRLTFQRSAAIAGVLADVACASPPWAVAARKLTADSSIWTPDDVTRWLDDFVARRNRIVHGGDLKQGGGANPIRRDDVALAARVVAAVGVGVEASLQDRLKAAH